MYCIGTVPICRVVLCFAMIFGVQPREVCSLLSCRVLGSFACKVKYVSATSAVYVSSFVMLMLPACAGK